MAANYTINKTFSAFGGLNLRISDLLRSDNFATVATNISYRKTGAMSKRKGYQILAESTGGYGLTIFPDTDIESGDVTEQLVAVDENLWKVEESSFTITYSGSDTAYFDLFVDSDNKFKFKMYDNGALVLSYDLGTGKELSFTTLSTLITQINGVANFAATGSLTTEPAAFIPVTLGTSISTGGTDVSFQTWVQVQTPSSITDPFSTFYAARNNDDFENASFAVVNNVLYIGTGYDDLHKYDSLRVYKAGLPAPASAASISKLGSGSLTGAYKYSYFYRHIDSKGNVVESNRTTEEDVTLASEDARLTLQNLQASTGYNTSQAIVNGGQSGVNTITVDSGHTILEGDKVYFYDGSTSAYVTRNVTATTATTITIDGAVVNVSDNDIINPQLKIVVLRTVAGGDLFYEIAELVNDSSTATQTYDDSAADSTLVIEFVDPAKPRDLPPKGKYLDVWRNTLIITGNRENPNTVYFSDIDGAEYFPSLTNNFIIESNDGSKNSGLRSLDNILYVFKKNSIAGITGDLALNQFQVDVVNKQGVGCAAHATLAEIENEVWFLSEFGVYSIGQGGLTKKSDQIDPKFNQPNTFNFSRAVSYYWIDNDQYLVFLPKVAVSSNNVYYTSDSELYVYDTFRQAWTQWDSIDMGGGIADLNGKVFFQSKEIDSGSNQVHYLKGFHNTGIGQDYCDHESPIFFQYKSNWESLGEPSLFKKFLRIKVHSLDASLNNFESEGFSLIVRTEHDYVDSTVSDLILDFTGGAEGWGGSPWGQFPWGEDRLASLKSKLATGKVKSLRTVFQNNELATNVLVSGYEYEIAVPYQMRIKE